MGETNSEFHSILVIKASNGYILEKHHNDWAKNEKHIFTNLDEVFEEARKELHR